MELKKEVGWITKNIAYIGNYLRNAFIVQNGSKKIMIEAGVSCDYDDFYNNAKELGIDLEKDIEALVVLHSHFDHCGVAPILKKKNPNIKIIASQYSKEVFSKEKSLNILEDVNKNYCKEEANKPTDVEFRFMTVDYVADDVLFKDMFNLNIEVIETKGHSDCSISLYFTDDKALFTSDSGGLPLETGYIAHLGTKNLNQYIESLKKLVDKNAEIILPGHGGYIFQQNNDFMEESYNSSLKLREQIEDMHKRGLGIEEIAEELMKDFWKSPLRELGDFPIRDSLKRMAKRHLGL